MGRQDVAMGIPSSGAGGMKGFCAYMPPTSSKYLSLIFSLLFIFIVQFAEIANAASPQIAAGSSHTIALRVDGTVWAWGYNYYGQLGDGTTTWAGPCAKAAGSKKGQA